MYLEILFLIKQFLHNFNSFDLIGMLTYSTENIKIEFLVLH